MRTQCSAFFFFNDTATTEIYTLSLHDALPISIVLPERYQDAAPLPLALAAVALQPLDVGQRAVEIRTHLLDRSEEHTSELQSQSNLVCRLLLEKKKINKQCTILVNLESSACVP